MCRFIAYIGEPELVNGVLYKTKNSLIHQSYHAKESTEPLNGDGFGLGWYNREIDEYPAVFRSIRPAWNDNNLRGLSKKIKSECFLAHIRAANVGGVHETNCHPFRYHEFLFMHNGVILDFARIKRYLRRQLSDEIYDGVKGTTDSEHFFALFIDIMRRENGKNNISDLSQALEETVRQINAMRDKHGVTAPAFLNVVISDGIRLIALRYCSDKNFPCRSMYYSMGEHLTFEHGIPKMEEQQEGNHAALIVSERISDRILWHNVEENHLVTINKSIEVNVSKFNV